MSTESSREIWERARPKPKPVRKPLTAAAEEWRPEHPVPAVPGVLRGPIPPMGPNTRSREEKLDSWLAGHWASHAGMHDVNGFMNQIRAGKPPRNTSRYAFAQRRRKTRRIRRN